MKNIRFEWDENKNKINKKKHGLSFEEAVEVFGDENAILFDDPDHSLYEDRFLIIGAIKSTKICIVSHCYRDDDNVIRLISAREATKSEKKIQIYQRLIWNPGTFRLRFKIIDHIPIKIYCYLFFNPL